MNERTRCGRRWRGKKKGKNDGDNHKRAERLRAGVLRSGFHRHKGPIVIETISWHPRALNSWAK